MDLGVGLRGSVDWMGWGSGFLSDEMGMGIYVGESVRHFGLVRGACRLGLGSVGSVVWKIGMRTEIDGDVCGRVEGIVGSGVNLGSVRAEGREGWLSALA